MSTKYYQITCLKSTPKYFDPDFSSYIVKDESGIMKYYEAVSRKWHLTMYSSKPQPKDIHELIDILRKETVQLQLRITYRPVTKAEAFLELV